MKTLLRALIVSLLIAFALCEIGLRLAIGMLPPGPIDNSHIEDRINPKPHQYDNSPYYSVDFVWGIHKIFSYRYFNDDMQYATHDLAVNGYTIKNDQRLTTDQPASYTHTVWLFGSSTVWGAYVADGWTIASYLQREFNARGLPWRVVNMGQPGINITIEFYWEKKTDIRPDDLVIYIDGVVDLDGIVIPAKQHWTDSTPTCQLSQRIQLVLLSFWCQSNTSGPTPQSFIDSMAAVEIPRYYSDIAYIAQYTTKHGASFIHYMQPDPGHDEKLYAQLTGTTPILYVAPFDYFDPQHYDDAGHSAIARQIAARFGAF